MPGGDGTGPLGHGPMTGRAAGYCAGFTRPGYDNLSFVRGFGRGWGRGYGRGYWGRRSFWREPYQDPYYIPYRGDFPTPNKEEEKNCLERMVKGLEEEIKNIRERIKKLSEEK